jgi:hypothetical protein
VGANQARLRDHLFPRKHLATVLPEIQQTYFTGRFVSLARLKSPMALLTNGSIPAYLGTTDFTKSDRRHLVHTRQCSSECLLANTADLRARIWRALAFLFSVPVFPGIGGF